MDGSSRGSERKRHPLLEAWKAQRGQPDPAERAGGGLAPLATGGTPIVGRASMVINSGGNVVYTQNWLGSDNNCEVDPSSPTVWHASTAYALHDYVQPTGGGGYFMVKIAGTSDSSEPSSWDTTFGNTTNDGSIVWVCTGTDWVSGRTYAAGTVVTNSFSEGSAPGFNYQAQNSGTSGGTEPHWPTSFGTTVNDNGITWKAIGYFPGSFKGCNPMAIAIKSSGGSDTVIAKEGDSVGNFQLSGWGEFLAMNASGKVAFKATLLGLPTDRDETGQAILLAGPGAGQLQVIAKSSDVIGGVHQCGFATMVGENSSGQVVMDGYSYQAGNTWQASHSYGSSVRVVPTSPFGLIFTSQNSGTSGSTEPAWPNALGATVNDNGITWTASNGSNGDLACDEDNHSLIRYTSGTGTELLTHIGASLGGSTVAGFGTDFYNASGSTGCSMCDFADIPGIIGASGHVPIVLSLADNTNGVYSFTGPGVATQAARSGSGGIAAIYPRSTSNNSDQVVYKAAVSAGGFWQANHTYSIGDFVFTRPHGSTVRGVNGIRYVATVGGTSGTAEPAFPTTIGNTVSDGGVTWKADELSPDSILRFTPPSTTATIVSVGDDVGTRSTGVANGITFESFGNFFDINSAGNVVFTAKLSGSQEGYYFWNGSTGQIFEIFRQADVDGLASEMITVNDSNLVAYVTGNQVENTYSHQIDFSGGHEEGGAFFWQNGTTQKAIAVGDTVAGDTVTSIYAQHQSFVRRQLSPAGCLALAYHDQGDDLGFDCSEGGQNNYPCNGEGGTLTKGGQLFVSCATNCPAILLSPPTLPDGNDGVAYNQTITATGGTGPYTFAVTAGSTGALNLASNGALTGSPSGTGTLSFTVTATDHNGCTASQSYEITVRSSLFNVITLSPDSLQTTTVGGTVHYTVTMSQVQTFDEPITLTSSDTSVATVPSSVTITAGNTTAHFDATGVAVGGPIIITATLQETMSPQQNQPEPNSTATDYLQVVEPQVTAAIPVLDGKGLLILFLGLAAAGWLAMRKLG